MKKSKISIILATAVTICCAAELSSLKEYLLVWITTFVFAKLFWRFCKCGWYSLKSEIRGPSRTSAMENAMADQLYTWMSGDRGPARRVEDNDRAWSRHQAQKEAAFQEYQARKAAAYNPNSYEAYQKKNRAQAARNKANQSY